ncbi:uncharacterized protein MELLADRAFT_94238 [Melampsora larici-populina 98AG31]|uniref:Uncharacterized protein n=1 Tax=Melampsora larici-populina (strain 98AG31 / pathotype 3-4-7) TaxID=747676 RepID=F4S702_MELLP|nr:uncharacterized protein MELLADRAFT_94238 [Melampsora larici-populina 98AG31]EGF99590.1 hypothetical protein MELLADRAFT_94238 [Melampsora larici-populina 98AG31]
MGRAIYPQPIRLWRTTLDVSHHQPVFFSQVFANAPRARVHLLCGLDPFTALIKLRFIFRPRANRFIIQGIRPRFFLVSHPASGPSSRLAHHVHGMASTSSTPPTPGTLNPGIRNIPVEIVELIIKEVVLSSPVIGPNPTNCTDIALLHHACVTRFLHLRLVSKSRDIAIVPFVFNNLRLTRGEMVKSLIRIWKESYITPGLPPLRYLYFDGVIYSMALPQLPAGHSSTSESLLYPFSILPDDAAALVTLCHSTLTELKLRFINCVGFTPALSDALNLATGLETLNIESYGAPMDGHDAWSIKLLLERVSSIRSLSFNMSPLPPLNLQGSALPHLEHFWLECDIHDIEAGIDLCHSSYRPINCLELFTREDHDPAGPLALGLVETLEILFIVSIPDRIPEAIRNTVFPKLHVLRIEYCYPVQWETNWLEWPVLKMIEVLVTSYWHGSVYWRSILTQTDINSFKRPPKLKHIVFAMPRGEFLNDIDLVERFHKIRIQCHFIAQPTRETSLRARRPSGLMSPALRGPPYVGAASSLCT